MLATLEPAVEPQAAIDASPLKRGRRWSIVWLTAWLAVGAFSLFQAFLPSEQSDPDQFVGALGRNYCCPVTKPIAEIRLGVLGVTFHSRIR